MRFERSFEAKGYAELLVFANYQITNHPGWWHPGCVCAKDKQIACMCWETVL